MWSYFKDWPVDFHLILLLTAFNIAPVSYTHLDVYKRQHYDGVITSIDYNYPIKVTIKTDEDVSKTFIFNKDVEVTRNDDDSSFDQVRVGDEVTITTEYDEMIAINTIAKEARCV